MASALRRKEPGPWWSRPALLLGLFSVYALVVWVALLMVGRMAPLESTHAPATLDVAEKPQGPAQP